MDIDEVLNTASAWQVIPQTSQSYLEVACFSLDAAIQAFNTRAADRIELCSNQDVGGITPESLWDEAHHPVLHDLNKDIPIHMMIRPIGGDFIYDVDVFNDMTRTLGHILQLHTVRQMDIASGIVFGIVTPEGRINRQACLSLVNTAKSFGLKCTFHRAFDQVENKSEALEQLIELNFDAVLTAGGQGNAEENIKTLSQLIKQADGRIEVIPGGGVRHNNVKSLMSTGARWYHTAATVDGGQLPDTKELIALRRALDDQV